MQWIPMQWGAERFEWVKFAKGRWSLIGHEAKVFSTSRGWGAIVGEHFLGYYGHYRKAMEAVVSYIAYEKRLRDLKAGREVL